MRPSRKRNISRDRHKAKASGWKREGRGKMKAASAHGANAGNPCGGMVLEINTTDNLRRHIRPADKKQDWWKCLCCKKLQPRCLLLKNSCMAFSDNGNKVEKYSQNILKKLKKMTGIKKLSSIK
jgi:hypothetical protein